MVCATKTPTPETYKKLILLDRQLKSNGVENKHDRVSALIVACITEGIDSGSLILHVLSKLQFNRKHVGKLLAGNNDSLPPEDQWSKDAAGRYILP